MGSEGRIEFVIEGLSGDPQSDWYFRELGPGAMVAEPVGGHSYVSEVSEHLEFVARGEP